MARFAYLKLTDKLSCQSSPKVYGALYPEDLTSASDVLAVEDQESLSFSYSRLDKQDEVRPITAQLRAGRVVTVVWVDDTGAITSYDEWRVSVVADGRGQGGLISVQCVPIWRDLVERCDNASGKGWVSQAVGTDRVFAYELTQRTATSILTNFVIANAPSYITLGTVDSSLVIPSVSINHLTPWAVAIAARDALRAMDVTCELRLRRNGSTDYKLDLIAQVGAGAAVPVFHPSNALLTMTRKTDATLQATRVLVTGGAAPDTLPGVLGRARWRGAAPSGLTIALTDRNGGANPIGFDGQWVGAYLLRVKTGRTFQITASNAAAGTVTLASVSTIAADEDFEFRLTEPETNTLIRPAVQNALTDEPMLMEVSAIDGVGLTLTLIDHIYAGGPTDPITVDSQGVDWTVDIFSKILGPDASTTYNNGLYGFTGAVTTVNVGDLLLPGEAASATNYNYGLNPSQHKAGVVSATDTVAKTVTAALRYWNGGAAGAGSGTIFGVRVYRYLRSERVTASVASTNKITLGNVSGINALDLVVLSRQYDGAGEVPCFADHPTYAAADPTGYGVKIMDLQRANGLGIAQITPNSWMRTWTTPSNPPDGYSVAVTGTGATSQDTSVTRLGGHAWKFDSGSSAGAVTMTSPVIYPTWNPTRTDIAARAWVYFSTYAAGGAAESSTFKIYAATAAGAAGTALATVTIMPTDSTAAFPSVAAGGWVELKIEGLSLGAMDAPYGIVLVWAVSTAGSAHKIVGYLDTMECYPFAACPTASYEFGDANGLHQAANTQLAAVASPPVYYEFNVRDLERAFPTEYSRLALTLGGMVRAADVEYGIDTTVRLLKLERDLLNNTNTRLTLANRPIRFTSLANTGVAFTTGPTSALVDTTTGVVLTAPPPPLVAPNPSGNPNTVPFGVNPGLIPPKDGVTIGGTIPTTINVFPPGSAPPPPSGAQF